jgi:trimethylamine--corrinoid protein Co-methyltransferase
VQLISEYYGCPSGVHGGKTDSCFVNVQAGIDKAMTTVFPVLAGAVGIGTVGHLENAVTFSPQQLVIDNEIFRSMRRALQPIRVDEETLAADLVGRVGPGGNYLGEEHTVRHFREESFFSSLFETLPWAAAHDQDAPGMERKAWEAARAIWQEEPEPVLDEERMRAIDRVVRSAEKHLVK